MSTLGRWSWIGELTDWDHLPCLVNMRRRLACNVLAGTTDTCTWAYYYYHHRPTLTGSRRWQRRWQGSTGMVVQRSKVRRIKDKDSCLVSLRRMDLLIKLTLSSTPLNFPILFFCRYINCEWGLRILKFRYIFIWHKYILTNILELVPIQ